MAIEIAIAISNLMEDRDRDRDRNFRDRVNILLTFDQPTAHNSRLTPRETNHYITRCASVLAWSNLNGRAPQYSEIGCIFSIDLNHLP